MSKTTSKIAQQLKLAFEKDDKRKLQNTQKFDNDLNYGHALESVIKHYLESEYTVTVTHTSSSFLSTPGDLTLQNGIVIEVKSDEKSFHTQNLFFEMNNPISNLPSGVRKAEETNVDFYFHVVPSLNVVYIFPLPGLSNKLHELYSIYPEIFIGHCKSGNSSGYVFPRKLLHNLNHRVLVIENLKEKILNKLK